jgi:hypothetical protein
MNHKKLSLFSLTVLCFLAFLNVTQAHQQRDSYFEFTQKYIYYSEEYNFNNLDGKKLSTLMDDFFQYHQDEESMELQSQMTLYNNTLANFSTYYNYFYAELATCDLNNPTQAAQLEEDQQHVSLIQTDYFLMKNGLLKFAKILDQKKQNLAVPSSDKEVAQ